MGSKRRGTRSGLDEILADLYELKARGELPDLAAANAYLEQRTNRLNATPDPAMQGLSPHQAYELVHSDWLSDGPLRLTKADTVRAVDLRKCAAAWMAAVAAFPPVPGLFGDEDGRSDAAVAIEVLGYAGLLEPFGASLGVAREASAMLRGSATRFAAVIADARLRLFAAWDESPFDDIVPGLEQPAMVMRAVAVFSVRYAMPLEEYGLIEIIGEPGHWKKMRLRVLPRFRRLVHLADEPPALRLI